METTNVQGVGLRGEGVVILMPRAVMTRQEALTHAAWLVACATGIQPSEGDKSFEEILEAVQNT